METEGGVRLAQVLVGIRDPRQAKKVEHDLVRLLVVAVCVVLSGADDFVEIEAWGKAKLGWLPQFLRLEYGIASHDTFGRVFAAIDAEQFGAALRRWVSGALPALDKDEVVSIDGKTPAGVRVAGSSRPNQGNAGFELVARNRSSTRVPGEEFGRHHHRQELAGHRPQAVSGR